MYYIEGKFICKEKPVSIGNDTKMLPVVHGLFMIDEGVSAMLL